MRKQPTPGSSGYDHADAFADTQPDTFFRREMIAHAVDPTGKAQALSPQRRDRTLVGGRDLVLARDGDAEVADEAVLERVSPAVDGERLTALPGLVDDGGLRDIDDLLNDVEFAEPVRAGFVGEGVDVGGVLEADVLNVAEPIINETDAALVERGGDTSAAVVANNDDVLDAEDIDAELEAGEAVQVGVDDDVGDVAMDEKFAGTEVDDGVGGNAGVGAADPEILRRLLLGESSKKGGIVGVDLGGPAAVVGDEMLKVRHAALLRGTDTDVERRGLGHGGRELTQMK